MQRGKLFAVKRFLNCNLIYKKQSGLYIATKSKQVCALLSQPVSDSQQQYHIHSSLVTLSPWVKISQYPNLKKSKMFLCIRDQGNDL